MKEILSEKCYGTSRNRQNRRNIWKQKHQKIWRNPEDQLRQKYDQLFFDQNENGGANGFTQLQKEIMFSAVLIFYLCINTSLQKIYKMYVIYIFYLSMYVSH